ncbi:MAG: hypothetical protein Q8916_09660 [Bacteroidota bacterium]|nr:hypothetical protein [Bacteroidota bacterium]MDP4230655.1 hypothetical protein [Bacteroidota bacterium]MDP4235010.1 hypothetical protein [Bacteroidota bacterium]
MHKIQTLGKWNFLFFVVIIGFSLASCKEQIADIGSRYLHDTISSGIHTFSDSSAFTFQPVIKRTALITLGRNVAINSGAAALIFGKVPSENLEAWAAMKIPIMPDSIGQILNDTLILRMRFAYQYGNTSDQSIDFSIYTEVNNKVNDSTTTLSLTDLGQIVGSYKGTVANDSLLTISIPLDNNLLSAPLRTASLALVLVPNSGMNTMRAFASIDNGDNTFSPQLKFTVKQTSDTTSITRYPTNDFHIVLSDKPAPAGEILLRGSYAARARVVINMKNIRDALQLNPFATINSAIIQVRSDAAARVTSNVPVDTVGPSLVYIPNTSTYDSGHVWINYGTHSTADPDLYEFQVRSYVENALRLGNDSLVLELRAGFRYGSISGSSVDVEDLNINRWVLYGMDYGSSDADKAKRPKLVITYSYLR